MGDLQPVGDLLPDCVQDPDVKSGHDSATGGENVEVAGIDGTGNGSCTEITDHTSPTIPGRKTEAKLKG